MESKQQQQKCGKSFQSFTNISFKNKEIIYYTENFEVKKEQEKRKLKSTNVYTYIHTDMHTYIFVYI